VVDRANLASAKHTLLALLIAPPLKRVDSILQQQLKVSLLGQRALCVIKQFNDIVEQTERGIQLSFDIDGTYVTNERCSLLSSQLLSKNN